MLAGRNPVALSGRINLEDVCLCAKERLLPVVHHNIHIKSFSKTSLRIFCTLKQNIYLAEIKQKVGGENLPCHKPVVLKQYGDSTSNHQIKKENKKRFLTDHPRFD